LIIGIVIGRVGKTPAFISLDNCVNRVQQVLSEASSRAIINGKKIIIQYSNKQFSQKNNNNFKRNSTLRKYTTYTVPEAITVDFPKLEDDENVFFMFFPDGSASAPEMNLNLKKHSATIKISKLTGMVNISDI
jgi:hypothetical protein